MIIRCFSLVSDNMSTVPTSNCPVPPSPGSRRRHYSFQPISSPKSGEKWVVRCWIDWLINPYMCLPPPDWSMLDWLISNCPLYVPPSSRSKYAWLIDYPLFVPSSIRLNYGWLIDMPLQYTNMDAGKYSNRKNKRENRQSMQSYEISL
mgnify:CR=1 FL=1